jgi:uncharacterized protein
MLVLSAAIGFLLAPKEVDLPFKTTDGIELHGTYLEPEHSTGTKLKAVLLLPGSGPTDRNGNQPPAFMANTLKQFAEALAAQGIASYRFDKRAAHANAAVWPKDAAKLDDFFAMERFVGDAESAFELLKSQSAVDPAHVGMLGHSEGGLITLILASKLGKEKIPAVALFATAGRTLDVVIEEQILNLLHQQTTDQSVVDSYMKSLREGIEHVKKTSTVPTDMPAGLKALFPPGSGKLLGSYFTIDPATLAHSYKGNVLLLQGEKDIQVSPDKDFPPLLKALKSRESGETTPVLIPNASHNMKHVDGPTDAGITGPVIPEVLQKLVAWAKNSL